MVDVSLIYGNIDPTAFLCTVTCAFIFCALAVGGGVGGGALYMPIYVFVTGDAHLAVPLAKVTTNGVGWSAFFFNMMQQHPSGNGPLIDYDVSLVLEPWTLVGTIAGVVLNLYATTAEVLILLVLVLTPTAWSTIVKGLEQKEKEEEAEESEEEEDEEEESNAAGESPDLPLKPSPRSGNIADMTATSLDSEVINMLAEDHMQYPWSKIIVMCLIWAVHGTTLVHVGGTKAALCGGMYEKMCIVGLVVFHTVFTLWWRKRMLERQADREELGINNGSYKVDEFSTIAYPLASGFAGICAGGLGIAGGLIKGPLMLNWGLAPQASTATAIYMIMFTSSSTILQYALIGALNPYQAVAFWLVGFTGGLTGSKIVMMIMKKCGKQWHVTFGLGLLVALSGISMSGVSLMRLLGVVQTAHHTGSICGAPPTE